MTTTSNPTSSGNSVIHIQNPNELEPGVPAFVYCRPVSEYEEYQPCNHKDGKIVLPESITVGELRDVIKDNFGSLVIRRVFKVSGIMEYNGLRKVTYVDAPIKTSSSNPKYESGVKTLFGTTAEPEDFDKAKYTKYEDVPSAYYGFTEKEDCFVYGSGLQVGIRKEIAGRCIYFNDKTVSGFDVECKERGWFVDKMGRCPPPTDSCIAGIVKVNEKGPYYAKWFYPSSEFLRLYALVMTNTVMTEKELGSDKLYHDLDCHWHHEWKWGQECGDCYYKGNRLTTEMRLNIAANGNTNLYHELTSCNFDALYDFYQVYCIGKIVWTSFHGSPFSSADGKIQSNVAVVHWILRERRRC